MRDAIRGAFYGALIVGLLVLVGLANVSLEMGVMP